MVVLLSACNSSNGSTTMAGGSGGQTQVGAGGRGGQGGQTTAAGGNPGGTGGQGGQTTAVGGTPGGRGGQGGQTTAAGGNPGGTGGRDSQGGQTTAAGGSPGGTGGRSGQGGTSTETQPDAAAGAGGAGGRGGNTSQPQADASDTALGGAGGDPGGDAGGASGKDVAADAPVGNPSRVLLADEGNRRVLLVDLQNPTSAVWSTQLNDPNKDGDSMRDIQLVGGDRVAVSVAKGYVELDIKTGAIKKEVSNFAGVESIRRLPSGNTVLGANNASGQATLQELDSQDAPVAGHNVTFTNYSQFRMLRRTPQGTFLIGVGAKLAEVNWTTQPVWEMTIPDGNYVYQGLRLPDKTIAVTSGYGAAILVIDPAAKKVLTTIGGKSQPDATTIVPNFYAGYQILPNGHFVVTNWEGHGGGNGGKGIQLLEYDPSGLLVWKWKQDPNLVSSIHHVIVLDGLDTTKLHDDVNGVLAPVTQ
jgi:hypothetical protein